MKVNERKFDKMIESLLLKKDTDEIQKLLGFKYEGRLFDEKGLLSKEFLRCIMIKRDEIVYGLKDIQIVDNLNYNNITEELETDKEKIIRAEDMHNADKITVIKAKDKKGQSYTFFYYGYENDVDYSNCILRQMRLQSEDGTNEKLERRVCFVSNKDCKYPIDNYNVALYYSDGVLLVINKDKKGNKIAALRQDDLYGCEYYEYNKDGSIILRVNEKEVEHDVIIDEQKYKVRDGLIEPDSFRIYIKENRFIV